jgi:hypothetical protein
MEALLILMTLCCQVPHQKALNLAVIYKDYWLLSYLMIFAWTFGILCVSWVEVALAYVSKLMMGLQIQHFLFCSIMVAWLKY